MQYSRKADRIDWRQLNLSERMTMIAIAAGPRKNTEWSILRVLCFHKLAEITPVGLRLTRFGRQVMAERHGLPYVVGVDSAPHSMAGGAR